jgi:hypothetical protein
MAFCFTLQAQRSRTNSAHFFLEQQRKPGRKGGEVLLLLTQQDLFLNIHAPPERQMSFPAAIPFSLTTFLILLTSHLVFHEGWKCTHTKRPHFPSPFCGGRLPQRSEGRIFYTHIHTVTPPPFFFFLFNHTSRLRLRI